MTSIVNQAHASGTGSIVLAAPNTNSNQTLTLPDETGTLLSTGSAVRTQKGVPAFSAYQSAAHSLTSNTFTKVQFQAKDYDTTTAFDNTTNYRFQPLTAGYYQVCGRCGVVSASSNNVVTIFKNGVEVKRGNQGTLIGSNVAATIYLNGSTDYLELWMFQATGAPINTVANSIETYFQGILIAAA